MRPSGVVVCCGLAGLGVVSKHSIDASIGFPLTDFFRVNVDERVVDLRQFLDDWTTADSVAWASRSVRSPSTWTLTSISRHALARGEAGVVHGCGIIHSITVYTVLPTPIYTISPQERYPKGLFTPIMSIAPIEMPSKSSLTTVFAFIAFTAFTLISIVQVNRDPSETLMWINLALGVTGMAVVGVQVITRYRRRPSDA